MLVFCLLNGGVETASARERLLKYRRDLEQAGIRLDVHVAGQVAPGWRGRASYWAGLRRRALAADGVLVHRVALTRLERAVLASARRPILFDVDDAIWYEVARPVAAPRRADLLATMRLARTIRVGSEDLAAFARTLGRPVRVAPTCVTGGDAPARRSGRVTVGWIGNSPGYAYFRACAPVLRDVDARVLFVGDRPPPFDGVEFERWSLERETDQLRSFDIGIMPVEDSPFGRGKCGYKLLLYMAHGIPVIASPVGVNAQLLRESGGGVPATTQAEWRAALEDLVAHPRRRAELGRAGRAYVAGRYDHAVGLRDVLRDLRDAFAPPSKPRRRVAMFLFHHPPLGGSASVRNATLARHLRDRGWEPRVISASRWPTYFRDPSIEGVAPAARVAAADPARLRLPSFPDRMILWLIAALPAALREARGAAAILSTSPPESAHLLAWLVRRLTGRPWIADHSNEWSDNPARKVSRLDRPVERFVMRSADRITPLSPHHTLLLQASYPRPNRIETLWTGWDPAEAKPPQLRPPGPRAVVLFAGMFYGVQRPDPFLDIAEGLDIDFHVLGNAWDSTESLKRASIPVSFFGRVPRAAALQRMRDADFLLVTLTAPGVIPGKMFEYAAAGRPILAVVPPDGEVARWVRETRTGFVVTTAAELRDLLARWRSGRLEFSPDAQALARYSAPRIADALDRIVREAIASRYTSR